MIRMKMNSSKAGWGVAIIGFLTLGIQVAVVGGFLYAAVHFIRKFW